MKATGLRSQSTSSLPIVSAVASVLLHAGLFAGTLLVSAHLDTLPPEDPGPASAQFLYPLLKPMPRPVREVVTYIGLSGTALAPEATRERPAPRPSEAPPTPVPVEEVRVPEPPRTFSEIEVDSAATRDPESVGPSYPPNLLAEKVEGATRVQFVVDSAGRVDIASLVVLESTHPDFTQAVRDVLPRMKYQPARVGKRPVAQLVEQRFGFRIAPV